jgi:hypothetical protein
VEVLRINGVLSDDPIEVKDHVVQFYQNLYSERSNWRPRMDYHSFLSIDEEESNWLERAFEEKEVWDVVKGMEGDKAPRSGWLHHGFLPSLLGCG